MLETMAKYGVGDKPIIMTYRFVYMDETDTVTEITVNGTTNNLGGIFNVAQRNALYGLKEYPVLISMELIKLHTEDTILWQKKESLVTSWPMKSSER